MVSVTFLSPDSIASIVPDRWRYHDLVQDELRFLDRAEHIAAGDVGTNLGCGLESPTAVAVDGRDGDTTVDVVASQGNQAIERALDTIEDLADQTGG